MKIIRPRSDADNLIPNFCRLEGLLSLAFIVQMVAFVLVFATHSAAGISLWERLFTLSLYLHWQSLCGAMVLCWARRWLKVARIEVVFFVCWSLLVITTMVLADAAWSLGNAIGLTPSEARLEFVLRNVGISAFVSLLLLRYFWARNQWETQTRADSEARYLALQARIRPHFLFNSLNSVVSLIGSNPDKAEEMVQDLADLFRASLQNRGQQVCLKDEIELADLYLRIEQVRLGDKLQVLWNVPKALLDQPCALLVLQPLVENAVHHGISLLHQGGRIKIDVYQERSLLIIDVENPMPPETGTSRGTGVALDNIAQRLKVLYGVRGQVEMGQYEDENGQRMFRTRIQWPA